MKIDYLALSHDEIIANTRELIAKERGIVAELIRYLILIEVRGIHLMAGYSSVYNYCVGALGLSHNKACKRIAVARVVRMFPEVLAKLRTGELSVSVVALLLPKITEANFDIIMEGVSGRTKREAEFFLSTILHSGEQLHTEPKIEVKILCPKDVFEKLERAKEILAPAGQTWSDVLNEALETFLDKHDPMRKAERAQKRSMAKAQDDGAGEPHRLFKEEKIELDFLPGEKVESAAQRDRYIPQAVRHQVILRDQGRCTYVSPDGQACDDARHLEFDHRQPWALGGEHSVANLRLLCRAHNLYFAEKAMGVEFIRRKQAAARAGG